MGNFKCRIKSFFIRNKTFVSLGCGAYVFKYNKGKRTKVLYTSFVEETLKLIR